MSYNLSFNINDNSSLDSGFEIYLVMYSAIAAIVETIFISLLDSINIDCIKLR
jgi:hypothetical protein